MKKHLLIFLFIFLGTIGAEAQTYTFSKRTEAYSQLTGGTVVSGDFWDEEVSSIPMPFTFNFFDGNFTTLYIHNGTAMFNNPMVMPGYEMYVCDADFMDLGTTTQASPISYVTSGTTGSRILKVEWKNAGFVADPDQLDYSNFQLWLYEGSNKIEFHFGSMSVVYADSWDTGVGPTSAILNSNGSEVIILTGSPSNPTVNTNGANSIFLTGTPPADLVYVFTKNTATGVISSNSALEKSIYPNPFSNTIRIDKNILSSDGKIEIMNLTGEIIYQNETIDSLTLINTENLPKGIYIVEITLDNNTIIRKKMVKN